MSYDTSRPYAAAFVIFRQGDTVAFVLRKNTHWMDGHYGLPAGKVEIGESFEQAAIRETKEEVGVELQPHNLRQVLVVHRKAEADTSWVDVIYEAIDWEGDLYNAEPDKHATLEWLDTKNLPENVIPVGEFYLQQIAAGTHFAEYGWQV